MFKIIGKFWTDLVRSFDKKNEVRDQYFHILGNIISIIKKYQKKQNKKFIDELISYRSQIQVLKNIGYSYCDHEKIDTIDKKANLFFDTVLEDRKFSSDTVKLYNEILLDIKNL